MSVAVGATPALDGRSHRLARLTFAAVSIFILAVPARAMIAGWGWLPTALGYDYTTVTAAARDWLATGAFYEPWQLGGPYPVVPANILYPPLALYLFVPFVFLPAVLWWAIPLGAIAWTIWRLRPAHLAWPFLALCIAWPPTLLTIIVGNPAIWFAAAFGLGLLYRWPAALILVKPALLPFAFWGSWSRSWWLAVIGLGILSIPFGPMWFDWVIAVGNAEEEAPLLHSIQQVPLLLLPLIAWVGRAVSR